MEAERFGVQQFRRSLVALQSVRREMLNGGSAARCSLPNAPRVSSRRGLRADPHAATRTRQGFVLQDAGRVLLRPVTNRCPTSRVLDPLRHAALRM